MDFTSYPHFVHGNELIEGARFSTVAQLMKKRKIVSFECVSYFCHLKVIF